ncbi:MAG: hypothetical protein CVV44_12010 [Spirochaetae bacterium HGW-Spirochaetae-1]|jgi:hypothetical protein|nr:MAG: hypothetical protein CVV44_12010 [Spirochaetae bacterium HGW-Spirochaetae-1]
MKKFIIITMLLTAAMAFAEDNFVLTINGKAYDIGLDRESSITLPDGKKATVKLAQREYFTFTGHLLSFSHKNMYKPNVSELEDGIYQTMLTTPLGTGVIIQEYTGINPSGMLDLIIREVTKEEVDYGYKYEEAEEIKTVGAVKIKGKKVTTSYKNDTWIRHFYSYGGRDQGFIIITFIEKNNLAKETHLIDDFWKNLKIIK